MTVTPVVLPQLGVNDELVKIIEWIVKPGDNVSSGQELAVLETTKASFHLEAPTPGYFYPVEEVGREVPVGSVLAAILDQPNKEAATAFAEDIRQKLAPLQAGVGNDVQLTAKARRLIEQSGLDVSQLPRDRLIRESDVRALLSKPAQLTLKRDRTRIVAVYGASQGGIALLDIIRTMGGYEVAVFLDDTPSLAGTTVEGIPVWPGTELASLSDRGIGSLASHIADRLFRLVLRDRAVSAGITLLNVIHPKAYLSPSVQLGVGNVIKAGAVIETDVRLGDCCIIDNGAIVPHHNTLSDACHLAPGAVLGGGCIVGERTLLGVGTVVGSRMRIGRNVIARPGSVIVNDVPDDVILGGNPARIIGKRTHS